MRILHISDVHIRTLQRHDEYRRVFENLYRYLDELKPDLVINTGDTAHSKVNISPEFVDLTAEHLRRVSDYAPYHLILGNHDLNLANKSRQDALTPIVENIRSSAHGIYLHKKSGLSFEHEKFRFFTFSIIDPSNFPKSPYPTESVNIGLFHGSVVGAITDINWSMRGTEHDISLFDGLDYVMMGDVHKQQFFRNGRVCYAGSLIQQDFGEEQDKGFLLWEIKDKSSFEVTPYFLRGARKFYTIKALDDLELPDAEIDSNSRVRVFPPRALTFAEQSDLKRRVRQKFSTHDVVIPPSKDEVVSSRKSDVGNNENLRDLSVQEELLQEHLKDSPPEVVEKVLEINRIVDEEVGQRDDVARNVSWNLDRVLWNSLFQYGEGNIIDFDKLGQIVGIFSPNASGKSNLIDSINLTLFNKTTTGVSRNVHLINDESARAVGIVDFSVDDKSYVVERTLDRVRKKGRDESKGTCSFYRMDDSGRPLIECKEDGNESGLDRQDTDKQIQRCIGTYEDFSLTSLSAQNNPLDIIHSKESKRKEIYYRFLDLDIFETKRELAKDEFKAWKARVKEIDVESLEREIDDSKKMLSELKTSLLENRVRSQEAEEKIEYCDKTLIALAESLPKKSDKVAEVDPAKLPVLRDKIAKLESVQAKDVCTVGDSCSLFSPPSPSALKVAIDECFAITAEITAKEREIEKFNSKKDQDVNKASILKSVPCGDMFPKCRFLVDAVEAKIRLDTLDSSKLLSDMNTELADLWVKHKDAGLRRDLVQRNIDAWNEIERLRLKVEERRIEITKLKEQERKLVEQLEEMEKVASQQLKKREIEKRMKDVGNEKAELQRRLRELQNSSTDLNRKIGSEQGVISRSEKMIAEAKEAQQWCTAYEYYDEAMGKNGIPCTILSRKLPRINEEIAKILSAGVDFGVIVEYDAASQTMPLYLVPKDGDKLRPLELASGAQKFMASIAMRVALLRISSLPRCTTFVVDEGFGKLDPSNIEGISRIFDILRTSFKHVLIVSHLDVLKDIVDDTIEISTDEQGRAHVEVM
jgi:DNA repair exonuclease SbcCD ATPase subunit/DNA repair exonuclease SbcCD nuclease subunit